MSSWEIPRRHSLISMNSTGMLENRPLPPSARAILEIMRAGISILRWIIWSKPSSKNASALAYLQCEPLFDPLRTHPRYAALIKKIGFPQGPAARGQTSA